MRKDLGKRLTLYVNRHHFHNWSIGIDYYEEEAFVPTLIYTRTFQVNLLFFNLTLTHWYIIQSFPGV